MRRTALILLMLAFLLPLAACRRAAEPSLPTVTSDTTPETTEAPALMPEPTPEVTPTPGPTPGPTEKPFVFTRNNFPRLNGSTSTAPLAEAICARLLGEAPENVGDLIQFSRTTNSYFALMDGSADLILAAECNEQVEEWREKSHFEWLKTPFATDAFVFVVNEQNPVDSITVDQARKIYTGEITNWAELGGENIPILPFQRNPEAGSQTLMEKLVMQGTPMMEAPAEYIAGSMDGLMKAVKSYDNSAGAIGYSVYYYAEEMRAARGLKLLRVEGVEPTAETIRAGTYPLVNPYYVVISAAKKEDSPTRRLYDWVLSPEGQALAAEMGYVSVLDLEPASRELTQPEPVGKAYCGEWNGLAPLEHPETLVPYAGARLDHSWMTMSGCLFGLMTRDGTAVTPPVYYDIQQVAWYGWFSEEDKLLPLYVLRQGVPSEENPWGEARCTLAALDLSWVFPGAWRQVYPGRDFVLLAGEETLLQVSLEGEVLQSWNYEEAGLDAYRLEEGAGFEGFKGHVSGDALFLSVEDWTESNYRVMGFRLDTGTIESFSQQELEEKERSGQPEARWTVTETEAGSLFTRGEEQLELPIPAVFDEAQLLGDLVVFPVYGRVFLRDGTELLPPTEDRKYRGVVVYSLEGLMNPPEAERGIVGVYLDHDGSAAFVRWDGSILEQTFRQQSVDGENTNSWTVCQGLLGILELDKASYYDIETGDCVFRIYFGYGLD